MHHYKQLSSPSKERLNFVFPVAFTFSSCYTQNYNHDTQDPLFSGSWEIQTAIKLYFMTPFAELTVKLPVTLHLAVFETVRIRAGSFFSPLELQNLKNLQIQHEVWLKSKILAHSCLKF